jgi:1-acyl-sn-glycerol-3-phosphate acyltransferase
MSDRSDPSNMSSQTGWRERSALAIGRLINETGLGRRIQHVWLRGFGYFWMRAALSRWMLVDGLKGFQDLDPDRGVLLLANHRSFFDLYTVSVAFFAAPTPWLERVCFPVKADFFYEQPLGILVNLVAGAGVMYPPFFRQRTKARLNRKSLGHLVSLLGRKGWLIGFHPEGTRGRLPDPYTLLPMQPGAGEIALKSGAIVIPVFINGLGNDLLRDVRRGLKPDAARNPCICVFGTPIDLAGLATERPGPRQYKQAADLFGIAIGRLAEHERQLRAQCAEGAIPSEDPRWLKNLPGSKIYASRGKQEG